jgi:hypothetical protein
MLELSTSTSTATTTAATSTSDDGAGQHRLVNSEDSVVFFEVSQVTKRCYSQLFLSVAFHLPGIKVVLEAEANCGISLHSSLETQLP